VTDRISLRGLRVHGHHGVLPTEREHGQEFRVDVELEIDTRAAAADDDLTATVDYAVLADRLVEVVAGEPVNLIETLAARLATVCLSDPRVQAATIEVHKPHAPVSARFDDITVRIHRDRS
jgi:7,8-dihydroneopterin aldolase/epimerase/oxygenase